VAWCFAAASFPAFLPAPFFISDRRLGTRGLTPPGLFTPVVEVFTGMLLLVARQTQNKNILKKFMAFSLIRQMVDVQLPVPPAPFFSTRLTSTISPFVSELLNLSVHCFLLPYHPIERVSVGHRDTIPLGKASQAHALTTVSRSFANRARGYRRVPRSVALAGRPPTHSGRPPFGLPCRLRCSPPGSRQLNVRGQAYLAAPSCVFVSFWFSFYSFRK